jgi:S-methylmethionine-dependent homocysteine/selenocysteine methylase
MVWFRAEREAGRRDATQSEGEGEILREAILNRLERGDVLVVDGGTGSELHRRGVDLLRKRAAIESTEWFVEAWSTSANNDAPEVVGQVHADYLRVGADVILSNTFYSGPSRLRLIGAEADWERYLDTAVEMALTTRDKMNPEAYVAGSLSPPWVHLFLRDATDAMKTMSNTEFMGKEAYVQEVRTVGERLASGGVDFIMYEYVHHAADASAVVEALGDLDIPVFFGIAEAEADGTTRRGDSPLNSGRVSGVVLMCTEVENITPALGILREVYGGYVGAYPNNGYGSPNKMSRDPLDLFTNPDPPSTFARGASEWLDLGAQLVGGCCGTGPEHVRAIRHAVDTHGDGSAATES